MPLNSALARRIGRDEFVSTTPVIVEAQTGQFDELLSSLARVDVQIRHRIPTFNQVAAVLPNAIIERLGAAEEMVEAVYFDDEVPIPLPPEPPQPVGQQALGTLARSVLPGATAGSLVETAAGIRPRDFINQARFRASSVVPAKPPGPGIIPMSTVRTLVGADVARQMGIEGRNTRVAALDTGLPGLGFLRRQPQLAGRAERLGFEAVPRPDRSGHGSFVATEIGGKAWRAPNGAVLEGIAPMCKMAGVKVLQTPLGIGRNADILKGMELARSWGANIINMSLGSNEWVPDNPFENPLRLMTAEGTIFVVAAGNAGPAANTVGTPGGSPLVWTVGSINTRGGTSRFSSRGPAGPRIKPDMATYGGDNEVNPATGEDERIMSTTSVGSVADRSDRRRADSIAELMGTSMATPVAAGVLALMNEWKLTNRNAPLTNADVLTVLQSSGKVQNNNQGYGPINFNMVSVL